MKTKYIITDPCYLISGKEWSRVYTSAEVFCKKEGTFNDFRRFREIHEVEIAAWLEFETGSKAFVSSTGYGDWENSLLSIDGEKKSHVGYFMADSGLVCVAKVSKELEDTVKDLDSRGLEGLAAVFEAEGEITVEMDTSDSSRTVISIKDEAGNSWRTLKHGE